MPFYINNSNSLYNLTVQSPSWIKLSLFYTNIESIQKDEQVNLIGTPFTPSTGVVVDWYLVILDSIQFGSFHWHFLRCCELSCLSPSLSIFCLLSNQDWVSSLYTFGERFLRFNDAIVSEAKSVWRKDTSLHTVILSTDISDFYISTGNSPYFVFLNKNLSRFWHHMSEYDWLAYK